MDIWIISLISHGVFLAYMAFGTQLMEYAVSDQSVLPRLLLSTAVQFGLAGLGISVVCVYSKERFSMIGLVRKNMVIAIVGTALCFIPYIIYIAVSGQFHGCSPFWGLLK